MISITVLLQWAGLVNQLSLFSQHQSSLEIYVAEFSLLVPILTLQHTVISLESITNMDQSVVDHSIGEAAAAAAAAAGEKSQSKFNFGNCKTGRR